MRIHVEMTLDISEEEWAREYGLEDRPLSEIRADIRLYLRNAVQNMPVPARVIKD